VGTHQFPSPPKGDAGAQPVTSVEIACRGDRHICRVAADPPARGDRNDVDEVTGDNRRPSAHSGPGDNARLITQRSQVQILSPLQVSCLVRGSFRTILEAASTALIRGMWAIRGQLSPPGLPIATPRSRWMNVDIAAPADQAAARVRTKRPVAVRPMRGLRTRGPGGYQAPWIETDVREEVWTVVIAWAVVRSLCRCRPGRGGGRS
jgi:hypothetical protein